MNYVMQWALPLQAKHSEECEAADLALINETCENMISMVTIRCKGCGKQFRQQSISRENEAIFHKNIVYATLISGLTYGPVHDFFSTLDHGMINKTTFYATEQAMEDAVTAAAEESMQKALEEERKLAIEAGDYDEDGFAHITVECDGGYCKRSYHSKYDAASCTGVTVAEATGKVVRHEVMNKTCRLCSKIEKTGEPIEHKCYKNFDGPSSNMESVAIVKGFDQTLESGVKMSRVITDGDSKTFNKIKEECSYGAEISRDLCVNHAVKATVNRLKNLLQGKQRSDGKKLLKQRLPRIAKGLRCAIIHCANNNEDSNTLRKDLQNVPFHVFGSQSKCREYFCPTENRSNDRSALNTLIQDQMLSKIRREIDVIAMKSEQLVRGKTSNGAERFFSVLVKLISGKRIYLSSRGSYHTRSKLGVLIYNEEYGYHKLVFKNIVGRTPGETFMSYMEFRNREKHRVANQVRQRKHTSANNGEGDYVAEADVEDEHVCEDEIETLKEQYKVT